MSVDEELVRAIYSGDCHLVRTAFQNGANLNFPYGNLYPLTIALVERHTEIITFLEENGADPCLCNTNSFASAHVAAISLDPVIFRRWLEKYPTLPHLMNVRGWGPLHFAIFSKNSKNAILLIEAGADVSAVTYPSQSQRIQSPMTLAAEKNCPDLIRVLFQRGACVNFAPVGCSPLYVAAREDSVEAVEELLLLGANPCVATPLFNFTPLNAAIESDNVDVVHKLLLYGANILSVNAAGDDCIAQARFLGRNVIAAYLEGVRLMVVGWCVILTSHTLSHTLVKKMLLVLR